MSNPLTYANLQERCAFYGFTSTPLTMLEFDELVRSGLDFSGIYGIACDVASGWTIEAATVAAARSSR